MAQGKNINGKVARGNGLDLALCDMNMLSFILKDKKHMELLRVKVLCEEFLDSIEYEVFIDKQWYLRVSYAHAGKDCTLTYNEKFEVAK